jgi:hypothetical protein
MINLWVPKTSGEFLDQLSNYHASMMEQDIIRCSEILEI